MCGEFFASTEDFQAKLLKENEWADAWFKWCEEKKNESMEIKEKESEIHGVEPDFEEISVDEEIEPVAVAE